MRHRLSPVRLASAAVLAAWAALFWFLLLADRSSLYLSTRTDWVVPVGAVALTIAAVGRLLSARAERAEHLTPPAAAGLGVIVLPVVIILAAPPAALGSFAAARRSSFVGAGFSTSAEQITGGALTLVDIIGAQRSPEALRALAQRAGTEVSFTGFVTRDASTPVDEFTLNRFVVSCCVADALGVEVRIIGAPPGRFANDDWVRVTGAFYPLGNDFLIQATEVEKVDRPKHPYISP
jgi:uncharacterized repeat protein (TIGR03943 family)